MTFVAVALLLILVGALAALLPARRAATVNPVMPMRGEGEEEESREQTAESSELLEGAGGRRQGAGTAHGSRSPRWRSYLPPEVLTAFCFLLSASPLP
jgi:hypothetical protein